MAAPSVAWVDPTLDELITGEFSASLMTKLRNNQEHLYEVAHTGGYGGGTGHTHASSGAATVDLTVHENILLNSCPGKNFRSDTWTMSGFAVNSEEQPNTSTVLGGDASGEYLYQVVGGNGAGESAGMFGTDTADGMDCVVSFFIRPLEGAPVAGALDFGFSDGNTTLLDSAALAYTDITNAWTRVYARFTAAGAAHSTDVRFIAKVSTGFTTGVRMTGFQINRGRHLSPWTISNMEGKTAKDGNVNYTDMPDCPLLDQRIAMDDAVDLTP